MSILTDFATVENEDFDSFDPWREQKDILNRVDSSLTGYLESYKPLYTGITSQELVARVAKILANHSVKPAKVARFILSSHISLHFLLEEGLSEEAIKDICQKAQMVVDATPLQPIPLRPDVIVEDIADDDEAEEDETVTTGDSLNIIPFEYGSFRASQLSELQHKEVKPVTWVVDRILPTGCTLAAGKPKSKKTWFALDIALSVAMGTPALGGKYPVTQGDVLLFDLEGNETRLKSRAKQILGDKAFPANLMYFHQAPGLPDHYANPKKAKAGGNGETGGNGGNIIEMIQSWANHVQNPRLVIIDVLNRIRPATRGRVGFYEQDVMAIKELQALASEANISILLIHHTRQQEAEDPMIEISGSNGLVGTVDNYMVLKPTNPMKDQAVLYVDGREIVEPLEIDLRWDNDNAVWTPADASPTDKLMRTYGSAITPERLEIIQFMAGKAPMTVREISKGLDKNYSTTKIIVRKMVEAGLLTKNSEGKCSVSDNIL